MEKNSKSVYVRNEDSAIFGTINGIFLDSLLWPYLTWIILQLALLGKYNVFKVDYPFEMTIIFRIITTIITFAVAIFIAKPNYLISAYKKSLSALHLSEWQDLQRTNRCQKCNSFSNYTMNSLQFAKILVK